MKLSGASEAPHVIEATESSSDKHFKDDIKRRFCNILNKDPPKSSSCSEWSSLPNLEHAAPPLQDSLGIEERSCLNDFSFMKEQEVVLLNEICRACLVKTDNMKHLLEPSEDVVQTITKLASVSNIEVDVNDTLPCYLCSSCEEKLKLSYDFQQLCQKSHQFLLACISANSISFKVNSFKSLPVEEYTGKTETEIEVLTLGNNSDGLINFVDNSALENKIVSYSPQPDLNQEITEGQSNCCVEPVQNVNDVRDIDVETVKEETKDYTIPAQVEKTTKFNQKMRLPQFAPEHVNGIMKKVKEKFFKHVNCLYCGFVANNTRALSLHMTRLHKELKKQWCLWCNKDFADITEHKSRHKDDLKCPLCGKYKQTTGHFMEHLASHSIERSYMCWQCSKGFISMRHLKVHSAVHTSQKQYQCEVCSKKLTSWKSWSSHIKAHRKCEMCGQSFVSDEVYEQHDCFPKEVAKNVETEELPELKLSKKKLPQNYCKLCDRRVRKLENHLKKFHTPIDSNGGIEDVKALCSYCGKLFKSPAKLTVHVRTHTGETPYKCSYCNKRMSTRIHLVVHERTHTGEKPHICKYCGKGFAQTSCLNTHVKLHTGRTEECSICQKRFCRPSELKQHMRTHTGETPYICKICNQGFTQKSHLTGHIRKHTNERPFKCTYCEKHFKQSSSLKSHINIHLGKKPYQCNQCSYSCRQSYCLKQHMLQHNDESKFKWINKCDVCDQYFFNFESYSLHYNSEHGRLEQDGVIKEDMMEVPGVEIIGNLQEFS
ncbi:hypothetical protein NQ315_010928 [Exocentrus adspersus]|uniref:Uncharacterized protein n=1 Tax=Exocentrus adspersus TaxID=1586481 RepID=A0AAV8VPV3_9CUCU|nr:hypothetical protein NQ315_010928 [Exocentrus adspersus]